MDDYTGQAISGNYTEKKMKFIWNSLNINGKVDRKALADMDICVSGKQRYEAQNELEEKLHAVWKEVLGRDLTVAYEVVRKIRKQYNKAPILFVASGAVSPRIPEILCFHVQF